MKVKRMNKMFWVSGLLFAACAVSALDIGRLDNARPDGDLAEWSNIPAIRCGASDHSSTPLQWKGAADASATLRLAWKDGFLLIAGNIYDDSAMNEDAVEISLSAKKRYCIDRNTLRFNIIPAKNRRELKDISFASLPKNISGFEKVESAFKSIDGGYSFELFIPFEMIPDFVSTEQSKVFFQLRMTDADPKRVYPQKLDRFKAMISVSFAEKPLLHISDQDVELLTNLVFPSPVVDYAPRFRLEVSKGLFKKSGTVQFSLADRKLNFKRSDFTEADGYFYLESEFDARKLPDGNAELVFSIRPTDRKEDVFTVKKPVEILAEASTVMLADTLDRLEKAALPTLAAKEPFKASAYFSVVSALEWLKWGIIQKRTHAIQDASREIRAHLAAIEGGSIPVAGAYSLLALTTDPASQLVVEYVRERTKLYPLPGSISIHFGNLDLVSCMFKAYATRAEAENSLAKNKSNKYAKHFELDGVAVCDVPQTVTEKNGSVSVSPATGTFFFARDGIAFELPYVSRPAAVTFAKIILGGKPCTLEQRDSIRREIIKATGRTPRKLAMPEGLEAFCGDNHTHTFLSDGRPTPLTVSAEALYIGLDYHILADHCVYRGALKYVENTLKKHGLDYPVGVGVELNSKWGHMNVYPVPLEGGYSFGPTFKDMVNAAHSIKGAIIQWNHPDTEYSNLPEYLDSGLEGSDLDAWEHYPPHYSEWKRLGKLPVLTGGTDTHNGTFNMPERSFMFLPSAKCGDIAAGVRSGSLVMVDPWNGAYTITRGMVNKSRWDSDLFFYGSDRMIQLAVDVLADDHYLPELKKKRIAAYLKNLDVKALVNSSDAYETVK